MKILGPEIVTYGVKDLHLARKFWDDFGLTCTQDQRDRLAFETVEKTRIVVRPIDAEDLPPAVTEGSTVREVTWGVETEADLTEIANALHGIESLRVEAGWVRVIDPNGSHIAFCVTQRRPVIIETNRYNEPGSATRTDARAKLYAKATPQQLIHVVYFAPAFEASREFYMDRLQFRLSDSYPGECWFFRSNGSHEHHNLFLIHAGPKVGFHHVAFAVRNVHEVFGGGLHMTDQGWDTMQGPGRHPISSAYFWYFHNPCGGAAEYDWDTDQVTDAWIPKEWPHSHSTFAEWMLPDGVQRFKGF